ncbi:UTRA domain-containing protein [Streptomyces sp. NPDC091281]|uniref:UTRA domain-containing protein n=1 Tax=Streptomyces sp. NPDC091281 TaxID=3365985 RepID=UPI0038033054
MSTHHPPHRPEAPPPAEEHTAEPADGFIRRLGVERLARDGWAAGRSVWEGDAGGREVGVDSVVVGEEGAPGGVGAVLGVGDGEAVLVRRRRYTLDGKPVLIATSYFPAALVAGTAIARVDTGPGGVYARLAELGRGPVRFREEVRSRMPSREEADALGLPAGVPVVLVARTAYDADGVAVEVNAMVLDSAAYVLEYGFDA